MYRPIAFALVLTMLFSQFAISQDPEPSPAEKDNELREAAVAFLRETMSELGYLRTAENRISFSAELASLMWFHSEREASALFERTVGDFKALILRYDGQMNSLGIGADKRAGDSPLSALFSEPTDEARMLVKIGSIATVRQQIALTIAEHEPDLAFDFFHSSLRIATNPKLRETLETGDKAFEPRLIAAIADSDLKKATELARGSLEKGVSAAHIELLRSIYRADADKGIEFGSRIWSQVRKNADAEGIIEITHGLLNFGSEILDESVKGSDKKPVFSKSELVQIAEFLADRIADSEAAGYFALIYAGEIEKFSPSRAAKLRSMTRPGEDLDIPWLPKPPGYDDDDDDDVPLSEAELAERARSAEEEAIMEKLSAMTDGELDAEEREKIITEARNVLMRSSSREAKIMGLTMVATQAKKAGDQELANEIMRDAAYLVSPQPKNFRDYLYTLTLISGYAEVDADKAFPLIEDTIYRANELISALVKLVEFMDITEEIVVDGEFQLGGFGGQTVRGLISEISVAESTIAKLSRADFSKMRAVSARFDRAEVRILAKLLVLRSVLGKKEMTSKPDTDESIY